MNITPDQVHAVCRLLLERAGVPELWTDEGPAPEFGAFLDGMRTIDNRLALTSGGVGMSIEAYAAVEAVGDVWHFTMAPGRVTLDTLKRQSLGIASCASLDFVRPLVSLLLALRDDTVSEWLKKEAA